MKSRPIAIVLVIGGLAMLPANAANHSVSANIAEQCAGVVYRPGAPQPPVPLLGSPSQATEVAAGYFASFFGKDVARPPLKPDLKNGIWHVEDARPKEPYIGGGLNIDLCQSNGKVLALYGTQ